MQGPSITARVVLCVIASLALVTADHRFHHLESLRAGLSAAVYPIRLLADLPVALGRWGLEALNSRRKLAELNDRLSHENLLLRGRLQKLAALEAENMRLRAMLDSSPKSADKVLIAELLAVDLDPYTHQIVINKGERHGVYRGQPLLDAEGVMGQVVHTGPLSATAMLITDPSHAVPVQVNRNGLRSVALGTGKADQLDLPHIPQNADIRPGDLLVTSGLGGRFPAGYPVAKVVAVSKRPGSAFARITAAPTAALGRSREVLLSWPAEHGLGTDGVPGSDVGAGSATAAGADAAPNAGGTP